MNYAVEIKVHNDEKFYPNMTVVATREEAEAYGRNKIRSWSMADKFRVIETDSPVNYRWDAQRGLVGITSEAA